MACVGEFELQREFLIEAFLEFVLYIFIKADGWADGDVFIGLDE